MNDYLDSRNYPSRSEEEARTLAGSLGAILGQDGKGGILPLLGRYGKTLADNLRRGEWDALFDRLLVLFKCGRNVRLDGPMIGVTMAIRDSDYFRETARLFGKDRSIIADIEWMATCWNATFAPTGLWMGKTFEPVSNEAFAAACGNDPEQLKVYDPAISRVGRNFFRAPADPDFIQGLGLPVLTTAWHLLDRPDTASAPGFRGKLLEENLEREKNIPYRKTGGYFLANPGRSVVPELNAKPVWQLNYRWPALGPAYPMTRLVDELVQIADGIYLGQLVMATRRYGLKYQLFGYFLLLDDTWERHRRAIGFDVNTIS
jgi:hypothetical protein